MASGHIETRKGRLYLCLVDNAGNKFTRSVAKLLSKPNPTMREATKLLNQKINELEHEEIAFSSNMLLNDFLDEWLATKAGTVEKLTTLETYKNQLKNHVRPTLGNLPLSKINKATVQKHVNDLKRDNVGSRTIEYSTSILRNALNMAVDWELIPKNPAAGIDLPKYEKKEKIVWTENEFFYFLDNAQQDMYYLIYLLIITGGLRRGEALALEWSDFDAEKSTISITKSLAPNREVKGVKSKSSIRIASIPHSVSKQLQQHRKEQLAFYMARGRRPENNAIFTSLEGTYLFPRNVLRHFKETCKKLELPVIDIHSLRHLHVSIMLKQGIDLKTIQKRVGHSRLSTTLDIYSHLIDNSEAESAQKMDEFLNRKNVL